MSILLLSETTEADVARYVAIALARSGRYTASTVSIPGALAVLDVDGPHPATELTRVIGLGLSAPPTATVVEQCLRAPATAPKVDVVDGAVGAAVLRERLRTHRYREQEVFTMLHTDLTAPGSRRAVPASDVTIRPARDADLPAIRQLFRIAFRCPDLAQLHSQSRWNLLVAVDGDQVVGTAALYLNRSVNPDAAWFGCATTAPGHRGRGVHTALLTARSALAAAAGAPVALMTVPYAPLPGVAWRNATRAGFAQLSTRTRWAPAGTPRASDAPPSLPANGVRP